MVYQPWLVVDVCQFVNLHISPHCCQIAKRKQTPNRAWHWANLLDAFKLVFFGTLLGGYCTNNHHDIAGGVDYNWCIVGWLDIGLHQCKSSDESMKQESNIWKIESNVIIFPQKAFVFTDTSCSSKCSSYACKIHCCIKRWFHEPTANWIRCHFAAQHCRCSTFPLGNSTYFDLVPGNALWQLRFHACKRSTGNVGCSRIRNGWPKS